MMIKTEDDDGYCSRSSLDSPIHTVKVETGSCPGPSTGCKEEQMLKNDAGRQLYASPSFLEVMLTRDDRKKSNSHLALGSHNPSSINSSLQMSQKSDEAEISKRFSMERTSEKEYQPRKTIKLMPSSSQNLLLFTKQSALSGLVVSSKTNIGGSNSVMFHSLIKNNRNISPTGGIGNVHSQSQTNKRPSHLSNSQPIKLTAAEVLKSKINNHPSISEVQKKIQASKLTPFHAKKVISGKDSSSQGSNGSFTSARTGQPYVRNSKGGGWGGRPSPYAGRHELHPVIDHDYCEFSAFNAEIQSGIILMSRETCARTDRLNMKRNKASLQPPMAMAALSTSVGAASANSPAPSAKINVGRGPDSRNICSQQLSQINQSDLTDNKRKYLKRKCNGSPMEAPCSPVIKNAVGRPRLSGKTEKNQMTGKRSGGYDSSDDLSSPPLTEDKNYVKIPGSFQNDFVYYATIRGRSSRKRHSENKSLQLASSVEKKNSSVNNNIKAFEWYKEMANTDKNIRFGSNDGMSESAQRSSRNADDRQAKLDITNLFSASLEEGKNLISESEVADLVMQMLPSPEVERNSFFHAQFLNSPTSDSSSADIIGSDSTQSLMDGIIDIGSIDLATELGNILNPEEKQDSSLDQHGLHSLDFPTMTSSQLLEDLCDNDLLMSSEMVNMNAFLNEFSDDQNDMCGGVESDGDLSSMIRADVMGLLASPGHKASQPACSTPPDSATIDSSGGLTFPCDLKEFQLDDARHMEDASQSTDELSSLLTPPPSLSPSSAPPELTTVNMFWNDLPGLLIEGREYVRLVDIHKQIMPAKDTGILKKRCIMLGLEVSSCSELQRDFLIRYMNAAKSKSKVIVTKGTALDLISFYIDPKMRSAMMAGKDPMDGEKSWDGLRVDNSEDVLKDISPPNSLPMGHQQQHQSPGKMSAECTKRSARLLNKRFSYLDMVNKGLPVSLRTSNIKDSSKQNFESPVEDLQQQWLDLLEKKFSQIPEDASSSLTEELDSTRVELDQEEGKVCESRPIINPEGDLHRGCEISGSAEESTDGQVLQDNSPLAPQISDTSNQSFEQATTELPSMLFTEEASDPAMGVDSGDGETQHSAKSLDAGNIDLNELGLCDSTKSGETAGELFEELGSSPRKSERILRSSTCPVAMETAILSSKNDSPEMRLPVKVFPMIGIVRQCNKQVDEPSNENRSPRLIRSKRHLLRPLSSSNTHRRKASRVAYKEVASLNARAQDKDKMQYGTPQSRPNRQARRKFDILKF